MQLTVLGSGSTGNGYVLQNEHEALVLECGMPLRDCLAAIGYKVKKVAGCLVTHEHGDHAGFIEDYLDLMDVYMSAGTNRAKPRKRRTNEPHVLEPLKTVTLGGFKVRPIPAEHDAAEPFAYIIDHDEIGRLLFATDTYFIRYTIPHLTNLMIECNYSLPLLDANIAAGIVPEALKARTLESHMSLEHLKEMLTANDLTAVNNIVLIHMSGRNSQQDAFVREITEHTGKHTIAATKGLTIELNKTPF